jgi:uncharacterized protein YjiS (DUF1127 family)
MLPTLPTRPGLSFNYHSTRRAGHFDPASRRRSSLGRWFRRCVSTIHQWQAKRRTVDELSELDDRDLRDIGLTRTDLQLRDREDPWMYTWPH